MSIFPTRILLATDGSKDAVLANETVVDLAEKTGSELHVVTVTRGNPDPGYATHEMGFRYETYEEAMEAIRQEAQDVIDEQVRKIEELGGRSRRPTSSPGSAGTRPSSASPRRWTPD